MTSSEPIRLPVQHKEHPHCPACKCDMTVFDGLSITAPSKDFEHLTVLGVTIHVQCECGQLFDLRKAAK